MRPWRKRVQDPHHVQCDWCARLAVTEYTRSFGGGLYDIIQACPDHREMYQSTLNMRYSLEADMESHPEIYEGCRIERIDIIRRNRTRGL